MRSPRFNSSLGVTRPRFGLGGRVVATLFLAAFVGMGSLFLVLVIRQAWEERQTRFWIPTPCEIVRSEVRVDRSGNAEQPYVAEVEYRYRWEGREYVSKRIRRSTLRFGDYGKAAALVDRFPVGTPTTCFVNPRQPEEAVLMHQSPWWAFMGVIPLIFVMVGVAGIIVVWKARAADAGDVAVSEAGVTKPSAARAGGCFLVLFFSVFFLVGLALSWFLLINPIQAYRAAKAWVETPCVVESSAVRRHRDSDGDVTWSVDILYRYEFGGRVYRSSRYTFLDASTSNRSGMEAIVRRYPSGEEAVCYVNPNNPSEAVLVREWTGAMWLGLLPLIFVAVGAGGVLWGIRRLRGGAGPVTAGATVSGAPAPPAVVGQPAAGTAASEGDEVEPGELKPASGPLKSFVVMLLVAGFWNGLVSVFVFQAFQEWARGRRPWMLTLFLVPFVLVGLGLIGGVFYTFLKLFNPRVHLRVSNVRPRLGETVRIRWRLVGRAGRVRRLRLALEGVEEATYRRGTQSHTDRETFFEQTLMEATAPAEIREGEASLTLPRDLVPSLDTGNNKILWNLKVQGDIPRWPDIDLTFPITVRPLPVAAVEENPS